MKRIEVTNEFTIIESENGIVDVEYTCTCNHEHMASMTWCEENCNRYSYCQRIADANDILVDNGY